MKNKISPILFVLLFSIIQYAQTNPPTNLTATLNNSPALLSVELAWQYDSISTGVKFNVYKKFGAIADTGSFVKIYSGHNMMNRFSDHNVHLGKTYSYYVTAVKNNIESEPSNKVEIAVAAPIITRGKISGWLFDDSTNSPIYRGRVDFISATNSIGVQVVASAITDSNGFFTCKLKTGNYFIYSAAMNYIGEYFDNVATRTLATLVTLAENDSLIFNIGLKKKVPPTPPVTYAVTGWVKDANGTALRADLHAYVTNLGHNHPSCNGNYFTKTDSLGNFKFMIKAGDTIIVYCSPFNHTLKPEYWDNKANFNEADKIPVNGAVTDINFTLDPKPVYNNGINGIVTDSAGSTALYGKVYAYKLSNIRLGKRYSVRTDSITGAYVFTNLEPGNYILLASAPGYKPTYYRYDGAPTMNWRHADSVVVTETSIVNNIDFKLRSFNHTWGEAIVYGNIHEQTGNVLDAALVYVFDANGELVGASTSELDGSYQIDGLTSGTYILTSNMIDYQDAQIQNIALNDMNSINEVNVTLTPDGVLGVEDNSSIVTQFDLFQNYPNPFNPSTTIKFSVPKETNVKLSVYNVLGQEVAELLNGRIKEGSYEITFDGNKMSSGVYFYRLDAENYSTIKKMILQK